MRKVSIYLLLFALVVVFTSSFSYAANANNLVWGFEEKPDINIVIDGKLGTYENVPLIVNNRTLLPFREVLVNLGVPNDDKHIIWNQKDQSVTVYKDSTKIYLRIGSDIASVNDNTVKLDTIPLIYNNRTYIPLRFVSQSFDKKVVWDAESETAFIRETSEFNKVKDILDKSNQAMNAISKYKMVIDMSIDISMDMFGGLSEANTTTLMNVKALGEVDYQKKIMHATMDVPFLGTNMHIDTYYANNAIYTQDTFTGNWDKEPMSDEEFNSLFSSTSSALESTDILCASLILTNSSNADEILLIGDMYLPNTISGMASDAIGELGAMSVGKSNAQITIDKKTNLLKKMNLKINSDTGIEIADLPITINMDISFTDYNGSFEIVLPKGLENI